MIIDTSQGNIETYGDIKEFKTSIDPKNLEFITTLLSSNLYSDPEQSFIREIVSNAWDSHVEAGTTDTPVIIKFHRNGYCDHSITIRDYGTGLSPERFKEVYCNIGSSTKRDSNEFIGGFGIGKYSSLACSNTVYITSYYEGVAYYYVMVKSGNSITTNLLMEKPTTEKNGVEVTIKNIENIDSYVAALDYIIFFPNIYVDGVSCRLNNAKLKRFTNFAAATTRVSSKLLLGNVLYPCNKSLLNQESVDFLRSIEYTGIVIKFDVGEINITPNRESIIYTSDTIKKIEARIKAAKEELDRMVDAKIAHDYDNIEDYYIIMSSPSYYNPVLDELDSRAYNGYHVEPKNIKNGSITYNNISLRNYIHNIGTVLNLSLPNFKGVVYNDKIYQNKLPYSLSGDNKVISEKIVILNEGTRLINSIKLYLRENWDGYAVMTYTTLDEFKKYIENNLTGNLELPDVPESDIIVEGVYKALISKANKVDLESDDTYLKVKERLSTGSISNIPIKEAILYVYNEGSCYRTKHNFKRFTQAVEFIKKQNCGIILANMDAPDLPLWTIANRRGFMLIKARKDIIADLKSLHLKCLVDLDWVMKEDPVIKKVAAIKLCFPEGIDTACVARLISIIPEELSKEFAEVCTYYNNYIRTNYHYDNLAKEAANNGNYDPYTLHICNLMKDYISKHMEAESVVTSSSTVTSDILTTAVVVKTKAYRVNATAYYKMKHNKLLNVLCRK